MELKRTDFYINNFPLEDLLPDLKDEEEEDKAGEFNTCLDAEDIKAMELNFNEDQIFPIEMEGKRLAAEFYRIGYEAAQEIIKKKLTPI